MEGFCSVPIPVSAKALQTFSLCRRILVREERASGCRPRQVDDETGCGVNDATVLPDFCTQRLGFPRGDGVDLVHAVRVLSGSVEDGRCKG